MSNTMLKHFLVKTMWQVDNNHCASRLITGVQSSCHINLRCHILSLSKTSWKIISIDLTQSSMSVRPNVSFKARSLHSSPCRLYGSPSYNYLTRFLLGHIPQINSLSVLCVQRDFFNELISEKPRAPIWKTVANSSTHSNSAQKTVIRMLILGMCRSGGMALSYTIHDRSEIVTWIVLFTHKKRPCL